MPTPSKPVSLLKSEKKSHRTKAELEHREQAEKSFLTGQPLQMNKDVSKNKVAKDEFNRIKSLLSNIEKDDDLYGNAINRYCLIIAECAEFEKKKKSIEKELKNLDKNKQEMIEDSGISEFYKTWENLHKMIISFDRQIQTKRKMLFDIEKENIMTVASVLRSVPKKIEEEKNPLLEALLDE